MYKFNQIIVFPKRKDFNIPGELLKIEVYHNSFAVFFQIDGFDSFEHELVVSQKIFPIKYLFKFFKYNGSFNGNYFIHRPKELLEF